jgi:ketosteroid isomerase-like protein
MSREQNSELAQGLRKALEDLDAEALGALYADDAKIWHNFDGVEQTPEQNVKNFNWMKRKLKDFKVVDIRQDILDDGFLHYHLITGTEPPVSGPCLLRAWCADGKITRIEEFTDSAAYGPLIPSRKSA